MSSGPRPRQRQGSTRQPVFKTWKLVSGILSLVFVMFVLFQSCAAGIVNSVSRNGESGGFAGVIVSIMLLAGGIVIISTRNSRNTGGDIATMALFGIGAIVGFLLAGGFSDLLVWSAWCLANAIMAVVSMVKKRGMKYAVKTVVGFVVAVLVFMVILLVLGWAFIGQLIEKSQASVSQPGSAAQSEISYDVYPVTDLFDMLHDNALKADQAFNGKYVELYGFLSNIDSTGRLISIDAGETFSLDAVRCYIMDDVQLSKVLELSKGDFVAVRGKITSVREALGYSLDMDDIMFVPLDQQGLASADSGTAPVGAESGSSAAGINEPVVMGGVQATLIDVYESLGDKYNSPDDGKVFIVCEFEVENKSADALDISGLASYDVYVDDYDADIELFTPSGIDVLGGTIASGKKTRGAVVCQADPDWTTVEIHLKPDMFGRNAMVFVAAK